MYYVNNAYLMHHGIKGMKWGVRHDRPGTDGLYSRYKKASGKHVSARLSKIRNSNRMQYMSDRQKQSLSNAEKYWNARAKGNPLPERNVVKRAFDIHRSLSIGERAANYAINEAVGNVASNIFAMSYNKKLDPAMGMPQAQVKTGAEIAVNVTTSTAGSLLVDELMNRIAGHF